MIFEWEWLWKCKGSGYLDKEGVGVFKGVFIDKRVLSPWGFLGLVFLILVKKCPEKNKKCVDEN